MCGFLNGTKTDKITQFILGALAAAPGMIHPCPYTGTFVLHNAYIMSWENEVYPDGFYSHQLHFFNARDDKIFILDLMWEVRKSGKGDQRF